MATSSLGYRILSRPRDVHWAGWRTTTVALQQVGWELSAEQDIARGELRILMRHAPQRLYALTRPAVAMFEAEFYRHTKYSPYGMDDLESVAPLVVQYMASDMKVQIIEPSMAFKPIDAMPQMQEIRDPQSIEDFNIFAVPLARTNEIIVEPQEVEYFLGKILELQKPKQKEIRKRQYREDEVRPEQVFHAQILSFKKP